MILNEKDLQLLSSLPSGSSDDSDRKDNDLKIGMFKDDKILLKRYFKRLNLLKSEFF